MIAGTGALTFFLGLAYPKESDDISPHYKMMTSYQRLIAKGEVFLDALKVREIQEVLGFFFVVSLVAPNLEEFLIYYNASKDVTAL